MSHRTTGLYRILERAAVYERFQKLLGAPGARARFVREFLRPFSGARLLDIGCGTASLLDYLPADVGYTGFDLNPAYIAHARRRYGDRGHFYCARVGQEHAVLEEDGFDFVVAKSVLHHLTDAEAHHLLASAHHLLRPGGVFISSDTVFHDGQRRVARFLAAIDRGGSVRWPDAYRALADAYFPDVETRLVTDMLLIPYDHFIMRASAV